MRTYEWCVLFLVSLVAASNVGEETRARLKLLLFLANKPFSPVPAKFKRLYDPTNDADPQCAIEAGASCNSSQLVLSDVEAHAPANWVAKYWALTVLQHLRASMNLLVICTVPVFVLRDQADPVSLVLNTLSVLFVLEIDDLCTLFLSESVTDPAVAVPLEVHPCEAEAVECSKMCAMVITLVVVLAVRIADYMPRIEIEELPIYLYISYVVSAQFIAATNAVGLKVSARKTMLCKARINSAAKKDTALKLTKADHHTAWCHGMVPHLCVWAFFFLNVLAVRVGRG